MGHGRLSEQAAAHPLAFLPAYEATEVTENDSAQSHKPLAITAGRIKESEGGIMGAHLDWKCSNINHTVKEGGGRVMSEH